VIELVEPQVAADRRCHEVPDAEVGLMKAETVERHGVVVIGAGQAGLAA
jgi:hypothetical protein